MCIDKHYVILFVFDSSKCNMSLFVLHMPILIDAVKKYEYIRIFTNSNSTVIRNDVSRKFLNI